MASNEKIGNKSNKGKTSYERASVFSRLYCLYAFPTLFQNYKKDFKLEDIEDNSQCHYSDLLGGRLRKNWNNELVRQKNGQSASVVRALIQTFGSKFVLIIFCNFMVYGVFQLTMPLILGRIIRFSNLYYQEKVVNGTVDTVYSDDLLGLTNRQNVILYSTLLGTLAFINVMFAQPFFMVKYRLGMVIRVALTRLVYEKALRVTNRAVHQNKVGKVVNLISNDASRFEVVFYYLEFVFTALLETAVAVVLMYLFIGRASLGSLAIVLLYIPFQTIMANILSRLRSQSSFLTDDRLRLMAEILPAMRVIKMYVWERPFAHLVAIARKLEISKIRQSMFMRSLNLALFYVSSKVMSFVVIILFLLDGGELNAELVFVCLSLINLVRDVMTKLFPFGISYGVETYISAKRIEKFLLEEEIDNQLKSVSNISNSPRISLQNVTVSMDGLQILKNVSFEVTPRKLTVIIGPVGSGKSSTLMSILNELPVEKPGSVELNGRIAYASQEAWIFNGTVRENILFGNKFEPTRYREVINVSALASDIKQFSDGDQTLVDDRGTSLSGGQRARISLARALYTNADCYLLDDPLSAVDTAVSKHIFEKCIKDYLREKCVILVTHQLQFIKQADQIVVLKDGECYAVGSYVDLLNRGIDVFKYTAAIVQEPQSPDSSISDPRLRLNSYRSIKSRSNSYLEPGSSDVESLYDQMSIFDYTQTVAKPIDSSETTNQKSADDSQNGTKNKIIKIYWIYIRAGAGILLLLTFLISNTVTQVLFTGSDYWLSVWTNYQEMVSIQANNPNYTFDKHPIIAEEENTNIAIYSAIVFILFAFSIVRTVSFFTICMRASVRLHNRIFSSLIQAPIVFFDKTPIGIIMNRVSRDLGIIDDLLPSAGFEALEILGNSFGIFILCMALNYFIVFPFVVVLGFIYLGNKFYVDTARKLKKLEAVARSPMFNQMASTLTGLTTIRSYKAEEIFIQKFANIQDRHTSTYFTFISAARLFAIYLELLCIVFIYSLMIALNIQLDSYTGSIIGVTISQALLLCSNFNWGVRQYTDVETYMTSVERVAEFGQLEKEPLEECIQEPRDSWPENGNISYEGVSLAYPDPDSGSESYVLRNLSFNIRGGEKIGIVGRTGAGKSSLIVTLFRLTQPSGLIRIDSLDTSSISLSRLRKSLSIIPQEPIMFSGNIRRNLDPFNEKSDQELWDTIDKVQLKVKIQSFPSKLDNVVSESDFSVGQKQLICLARAILRKNRILILDEATANVDPRTDSLIQQTIRTEFSDCTVLTIAHRLNTIIDYDRVMVLDAGALAQFDTPHNLIEQKEGIFFELFEHLNQDSKNELRKSAHRAHMERQYN